jgi:hypothetical protein
MQGLLIMDSKPTFTQMYSFRIHWEKSTVFGFNADFSLTAGSNDYASGATLKYL